MQFKGKEEWERLLTAVRSVVPQKTTSEANVALIEAVRQAAEYMKGTEYPIQDYLQKNIERVTTTKGLVDNWLTLISLSCYAVGIAEGQRRLEILAQDIERAKLKPCDEYPKCVPMMLGRFRDALDSMGAIEF